MLQMLPTLAFKIQMFKIMVEGEVGKAILDGHNVYSDTYTAHNPQ
jgi:hypothetical protein